MAGLSELNDLDQEARGVGATFQTAYDHLYKNVNTARDTLDGSTLLKHGSAAGMAATKGEGDLSRVTIGKLDDITSQYPELFDHPTATKTLKDIQEANEKYDRVRQDAPTILAVDGYKGVPFIGGSDVNVSFVPDEVDRNKLGPYILGRMMHCAALLAMQGTVKKWGDAHTEEAYEKYSIFNKYGVLKKDVLEYMKLVSAFHGGDALFLLSALKETDVSEWIEKGLVAHGDINKEEMLAEYRTKEHMATTVAKLQGLNSLGDGFYTAAGGILDNLFSKGGTKGKAQINVNIPIAGGGAVTVGFEFKGEAERGDGNKLKARFELGATLTGRVNAVFFRAFIQARLFGYMEAQGDNGAEVFRLMAMALQRRIRRVSPRLADAVFSDYTLAMAEVGMDKDDYVESGLGVSVSAGFGSGDGSTEAEAGAQYTSGTRLTKGDDGEIKSTGTSQFEMSASLTADPFNMNGKFVLQWMGGKLNKVELEVSGAHEVDLETFKLIVMGQWLTGQIAGLKGLIEEKKRVAEKKGWDAQKVGLLTQAITGLGAADLVGAKGVDTALRKIKGFEGVKLGHRATLKAGWERGKGPSAEFIIERYGKIEIGHKAHSTLYLMLEGNQRVMRAKYPKG